MSILVFDGFDHYASQIDLQSRTGALAWDDIYLSLFSSISFGVGRGGYGRCVTLSGGQVGSYHLGCSFNVNLAAGFLGFAMRLDSPQPASADVLLMSYPGTQPVLRFRLYPNSGVIEVYTGDPGLGAFPIATTPPNAFAPYIWNFVEIGWSVNGSFTFNVNGNSVVSGTTGQSGVTVNGLQYGIVGAAALGSTSHLDDFYLCDTTTGPGTFPCNTFMGDSAVRTLLPTANNSVQWTPLASTNWAEVGESQFDGDVSYNSATTVGATDLFTFSQLPTNVSAVYGVQMTGAYRKQDAGANAIVQKVVSGGTTGSGAALSLSLDYAYYSNLLPVDPHTGTTWTPAAVNTIVAGYTLNS